MITLAFALVLGQQVLVNPSFEEVAGDSVAGWRKVTFNGAATFGRSAEAKEGKSSVMISSAQGGDAGWQTTVQVKPYSTYRLTAWIRTEGVMPGTGLGALINLHGRSERTKAVTGNQDWTQVDMLIETESDDALQINCLLGYHGVSTGKAYFDALDLELVKAGVVPSPSVTITGGKQYEPISKYIYSQFIEHLGRCIYGGIWAEMLEDRKFFYSVGEKASPWKAIDGGSVSMERKNAFVNGHSPKVTSGIEQGGLWLEAGREYQGRVWLFGLGSKQDVKLLVGGNTITLSAPANGWKKTEFKFKANSTTRQGTFRLTSPGSFLMGPASIMPSNNLKGMRADVVKLLRELNAPLYRWPGGNFVSGYEWRDGLGDPDKRPTRLNPAWMGIEPNDFGLHEFIDFCKVINTEPLVVVNTGFGDAFSAAQWVEYCNGSSRTEQGAKRAANGSEKPFGIKWWGIGNEMFGDWQLGYMNVNQYTVKHNQFYERMKAVDPNIITIGVGEIGGRWSERMLTQSANHMEVISEHFYCQERPGVIAHVRQIPNAIKAKVAVHRRLRETLPSLKGKDIRIAMDEWNYWYGPHVFGELGTRYFVKDGLGIAAGLHEYYRSSDIVTMAQYAQTVNVIGAIKTNPTHSTMETTGLVLQLYREKFGVFPVMVKSEPEYIDVSAALTEDRKTLTIGFVNPTGENVEVPITWQSLSTADAGTKWEIAHHDPMAYNDPENPNVITIKESPVQGLSKGIKLSPFSVTLVRVPIK